jgi:hypothetical protein
VRRIVAYLCLPLLLAGCTGTPPGLTSSASTAVPVTAAHPSEDAACGPARALINQATAAFTAAAQRAVAAGEQGDTAARDAAIADVRAAFAQWSAGLRTQAAGTPNLKLKAVLTEYAGAVDATVARVRSAADLDRLSTFDDQELDTAANQFAGLCP